MGVRVINLELVCDHATPERESMVRLHMDLPIPSAHVAQLHKQLTDGQWNGVSQLLLSKYPQHRALLETWLAQSQVRSAISLPKAVNA